MRQRAVPALLITLLVVLQAQLWFGRGSLPNVAQLRSDLVQQNARNELARQTNSQMEAEVRDLVDGLEMVEEKARMELGMVKTNEIFVQYSRPGAVK
ncbi:MAG: septum formation initiator family protein [Rhodoferax sp.]|nr:septum formation initiator family protein [Rhodoferax sp.]